MKKKQNGFLECHYCKSLISLIISDGTEIALIFEVELKIKFLFEVEMMAKFYTARKNLKKISVHQSVFYMFSDPLPLYHFEKKKSTIIL